MKTSALLVSTRRGGIPECRFRGSYAVVRRGRVLRARGEVERPTFYRSAAKPFQALAAVTAGATQALGLTAEELALMCGSHTGEPAHVAAAASILRKAGLEPSALQCGVHPPLAESAHVALLRSGEPPTTLHNNCSGKHAGMLAACRHLGLPTGTYLDLDHPYQARILAGLGEVCRLKPGRIGVGTDGCSAPNFAVPLARMAASYAELASAGIGSWSTAADGREAAVAPPGAGRAAAARSGARPARGALVGLAAIASAMQRHPVMVEGTARFTSDLIQATRGRIVAKVGAEGVFCVGVCDAGIGLALKIEDGSARFIPHVVTAVLQELGHLPEAECLALVRYTSRILRNHRGIEVGEVEVRI